MSPEKADISITRARITFGAITYFYATVACFHHAKHGMMIWCAMVQLAQETRYA